jgi:small subunit ribosomal protein S4
MPKRKHKKYSRPRKLFDIALMKEEQGLIKKYGLKTRREVWRANFAIERIRNLAKELITASEEEKNKFIKRQSEKGFAVNSIADVLGLNKENYLKRRLQSIVVSRGIARTHNQARQFITHKHITLGGNIIDSPSHLTTLQEEMSLALSLQLPAKEIITDEEKGILEKINHGGENKAKKAA